MTAFRIPSETVRGQSYKVEVQNGEAVCDCPGFRSHHHCKHVDRLLEGEDCCWIGDPCPEHNPTKEKTMSETETVPEERALAVTDDIPEALPMQMPATTLPTQAELSIIGKIAATVIGAKGHAVPASIDSPAKAAAVMLAGWEMGLLPMAALRHVYVVNGRTEPDAQAMMGIVRAQDSTARFTFLEYTAERCTVELRRRGESVAICTYTLEDAKKSGQLAKDGPWHKYPRDMLAWAAVKRVCRLGAADLVNAIGSRRVAEVREMLSEPQEAAAQLAEPSADAVGGAVEIAGETTHGDAGQAANTVTSDDQGAAIPPPSADLPGPPPTEGQVSEPLDQAPVATDDYAFSLRQRGIKPLGFVVNERTWPALRRLK